jgi:hypothetical protein
MPSTARSAPLRLFGPPNRLSFTGPELGESDSCAVILPDSLQRYAEARAVPLAVRTGRTGAKGLRMRLARTTPPGRYAAELQVSGKSYPLTLDVASAPRLRIFPLSADFEGKSGETAEAEVNFANDGNVEITVPETVAVGIYDDHGIEAAFADTYRQDSDNAEVLVGHWLRKLREGYGGLLKLQIVEGAGALEPGQQRVIKIATRLPKKLKPRHSYHGIWEFGPVFYRIGVTVQQTRTT